MVCVMAEVNKYGKISLFTKDIGSMTKLKEEAD